MPEWLSYRVPVVRALATQVEKLALRYAVHDFIQGENHGLVVASPVLSLDRSERTKACFPIEQENAIADFCYGETFKPCDVVHTVLLQMLASGGPT